MALSLSACTQGNGVVDDFLSQAPDNTPSYDIDFDPVTYDFGPLMTTAPNALTKTVTVTNKSTSSIYFTSVQISRSDDFQLVSETCSSLTSGLEVAQTCNFVVSFKPVSAGGKTSTVTVEFGPEQGSQAASATATFQGFGMTPANLLLSDAPTYNFGVVVINGVADKTLTLSNSGTVAATSIMASTLQSPFSYKGGVFPGTGGTCGFLLAGNASCTIVVSFSPLGSGTQTATLSVDYDNGDSAVLNAQRPLAGIGAPPAVISISDSPSFNFGVLPVGAKGTKVFLLTNLGGVRATAMSGGGLAQPMAFTGGGYPGANGNCSNMLEPSTSCSVEVMYAPTVAGETNDGLVIAYNNGLEDQSETRNLSGTAVEAALLTISDAPEYNYGTTFLDTTGEKTLTITNTGGYSASAIAPVALPSPFAFKGGSFPGLGGTCASTLQALGTCQIVVTFSPTVVNSFTATVQLNYFNGSSNQSVTRPLVGQGVKPASLALDSAPTLDFGTLPQGKTAQAFITVSNQGGYVAQNINGIGLAAPFSFKGGAFPGTGGTCGATLAPSISCTIAIEITAANLGLQTARVSINYNNGQIDASVSRDIQATVVAPALLSLSDAPAHSFGQKPLSSLSEKMLTLSNTGGFAASSVSGAGLAAPFAFKGGAYPGTGGSCTNTLGAGQNCQIVVVYSPTTLGNHLDTLEIAYNDGVANQATTRDISGTGVNPALLSLSDGPTYDFGAVATGGSAQKIFTLTNSGDVAATSIEGPALTLPFEFSGGTYPGIGGNCSSALNPGANCLIVVVFKPIALGVQSGTVTINYNDGTATRSASRGVQGLGSQPGLLAVSDGATYQFPATAMGATVSKVLTVSNIGGVSVSSMVGGGLAAPFSFLGGGYPGTGGTCGTNLSAGANCTVVLEFGPTSLGSFTDALEINYYDSVNAQMASRAVSGLGAKPAELSISNGPTYDFGSVAVGGTPASMTFMVSNIGDVGASAISGMGLSAPFTFKDGIFPGAGGTCGSSLSSGASCTIVVNYAPTSTGTQVDQIEINYFNVVMQQTATRDVRGTGAPPANLVVSESPLYDFGVLAVGAVIEKTLIVTNSGGVTATAIIGAGISSPFTFKGGSYPGHGGDCSTSLTAGSSCTVVLTFSSNVVSTFNDSLEISYDSGAGAVTSFRDLQAEAVLPASLSISDGPLYNFGSVAQGSVTEKTLTVTNSGQVAATAMVGEGLAAPYQFKGGYYPGTSGSCGSILTPGQSCTVVVVFSPINLGNFSDSVEISYHNGASGQTAIRNVQGLGAAPGQISISHSPSFDFGQKAMGSSTSQTLTLTNIGGVPVTSMTGLGLAAPFSFKGGSFPGVGGTCLTSLGPADNCTIVISFSPNALGAFSDTIEISYNDGINSQVANRNVAAESVNPAQISISNNPAYDFGSVVIGATGEGTVTLTNSGQVVASNIQVAALAAPFNFKGGSYPGMGGNCADTLDVGSSCNIKVIYSPTTTGSHSSQLEVSYFNGASSQQATRNILGTGTVPAALTISDSPSFDFGKKATGSVGEKTFNVTNTGGAAAVSMSASSLNSPFAFKGGSYPGTGGTCASSLAAAASCSVVVVFMPTTVQSFASSLEINYFDGVAAQTSNRDIFGQGVAPANLEISDDPTFNFGLMAVGATAEKAFTVTNSGGIIASVVNGSGLAAPFAFKGGSYPGTGGTCGVTLAPAATCTVIVSFSPLTTGLATDELEMSFNNGTQSKLVSRGIQGTAAPPAVISISHSPVLDFGTKATGSTATQTLTLSNTGGVEAKNISPATASAPFSYQGGTFPGTGGTCGATLAAGSSCTVVVAFSPTVVGLSTFGFSVTYSDGASPQSSNRTIQGTGALPALLTISDSPTYSFGSVSTGAIVEHSFTVTNGGGVSATALNGSGLAAPFLFKGGAFPGTGGTCPATLTAGASCTFIVEYAPTAGGVQNDTVELSYNDGAASATSNVNVTGTGVAPALLTVSDGATYNYGSVPVSGSKEKIFVINNSGSVSATSIADSGLASPFAFKGGSYPGTGGSCGSTLTSGATCSIVVVFNPTVLGSYSDSVELSYHNGTTVVMSTRALSGVAVPPALVTVSDGPTYNFGSVANGGYREKTLTVDNSGGVDATLALGGGLAAPFTYKGGSYPGTGGNCGATIGVNSACQIVVSYSPTAIGNQSDTIEISYNNGLSVQTSLRDVQGTSVTPANLTLSDGPLLDYGIVAVGGVLNKTITVTNSGNYAASAMSGSGLEAPFAFAGGSYPGSGGSCADTLSPSASCTLVVAFSPSTTGLQTDSVLLNYNNGAGSQVASRDLQGTGVAPALIELSDSPLYNFGTLASGSSADKTITLTNTGGVAAGSMSGAGLAVPFRFKGGSYPGTNGSCGTTLASGASCTVVVVYNPTAIGTHTDAIEITYNNTVSVQTSTRNLSGTAVPPASLSISDGPTYSYSTVPVGGTSEKTFTITNSGGFIATDIVGSGLAAPFIFKGGNFPGTGGSCTGSLAAGGTCTMVVNFAPTVTGTQSDSIEIAYNDGVSAATSLRALQGIGALPASLSISDSPTYNYGTVATGASKDKSFTVTNSGEVTATAMAETGLAAPFAFKGGAFPGTGGTCTSTLAAAASCSVVVSYAPTSTGNHSDSIDLSYNNGLSVQVANRALQGVGAAPALLTLSDAPAYNYGSVAIGGTKLKTFTVSNTGGVSSTSMAGLTLSAPFSFRGGSYPGTGGTCTSVLSPGATCLLVIAYSPSAAETSTITAGVSYFNGAINSSVSLTIEGTGVNPANLTISDGPSYSFGTLPNSASQDKTFTVTNSGDVMASTIVGSGLAAPFSFKGGNYPGTGGTCGASLNAAASCTIVVNFNPTATGSYSDTIELAYNTGATDTVANRLLQGNGALPASLAISDGPSYNFGTLANGSNTDKTFTVSNSGGVPATGIVGTGLGSPFFFKGGNYPGTGGTCGATIAATAQCTIVVVYSPSSLGNHTDAIELGYNDGLSSQTQTRNVSGTSVNPASLTLSDSPSYDFGSKAIGSTSEKTITVTNGGDFVASSMAGAGLAAPFTFKGGSYPGTGGTCTGTLNGGGSCTIVVTFAPTSTGSQSDTVEVNYFNGASNQVAGRLLQGTGAQPASLLISDGPSYDFGTVANGAVKEKSFTVSNTGGISATTMTGSGLAAPYTFKGGSYPGTGGTCGATLSASGTCTLIVVLNPTASGTHTDSIELGYENGLGLQQSTRQMTATSVTPASLSISDGPTYNFGTIATGASAERAFTVTNSGQFAAATLVGSGLAAPFTFKGGNYPGTGGTCGSTLLGSASCVVVVSYSPTTVGTHSDTIDLNYDTGAAAALAQRNIQGVGALPGSLVISDGPTYDFGTLANGSNAEKTFTVTNSGGVGVTSLTGGGLSTPYSFKGGSYPGAGGTCGTSLASGATCTLKVVYSPVAIGTQTDSIDLTYNDGAAAATSNRNLTGKAVAPASLSISDGTTFNYGTLATGAGLDKTFTVTNSGAFTASLISGAGLAAPFAFKGGTYPGTGGTCANDLSPSATCTIVVRFAPTVNGLVSDSIELTYFDGAANQTTTRDVVGTGATPAQLSISDGATYTFPAAANGASKDKTFTITNSGGVPATSLTMGGLAAPFTFKGGTYPGTGGNCAATLAGASTCTVVVTFAPTATGSHSDSLDVSYDNGVSAQSVNRPLAGSSTAPANITISDGSVYDYGTVAIGSSLDKVFTLTNAGDFLAAAITGTGLATPFAFKGGGYPGTGGTCGTTLAVGANCTIVVTFTPALAGTQNDIIEINFDNGATSQTSTRGIQGVSASPASLSISEGPTYNFGTVARGSSNDKSFTVSNSGGFAATSVAGAGLAAPYTFKGGAYPGTGGTCAATIAASGSCTIVVNFSPTATGTPTDTIEINYNNGAAAALATRDLTGTVQTPASLSVSDATTYDFGTVANGSTTEKTFTVSNSGQFSASSLSGSGLSSPFGFKGGSYPGTGGTCGTTLSASATCTVVVVYSPLSTGVQNGTMDINYYDGAALKTASRAMTGTAAAPASLVLSDGPTLDFGTIATTTSKDLVLNLNNTGGVTATSVSGGGLVAPFRFKGGTYPGTGGTCGTTLNAGGSCSMVISFSTTTAGSYTGAATVTYNDGLVSKNVSRNVAGITALPANLSISDGPSYDYGTLPSTGTASKVFTITNSGSLAATSLTGGGLSAPFAFKDGAYPGTGGTCAVTLAASASCTIIVNFNPTANGSYNDAIDLSYNDGATTQNFSRNVQGTGASPASLAISDGVTYDFTTVARGSSSDKTFSISNTGGVPATGMSGVGLAAPFTFKGGSYPGTGGTCATSLAASGSCTIVVNYAPTANGATTDSIEMNFHNGLSNQMATRAVTGTAVNPANLTMSDSPEWDYGQLYTTFTSDKTFTITNVGGFASSAMVGQGVATPFIFKGNAYPGNGGTCGTTLAAGTACTIIVTYAPITAGSFTDAVEVSYYDGAATQLISRNLKGSAILPTPPSSPTSPTIAITAFSQLDLAWTPSAVGTAPITYTIMRSTTSGSGYTNVATGVTASNYKDNGAVAGTTYYYKIRASGPGGTADSVEISGKALGSFAIAGAIEGDRLITLSWSNSAGAASYTVKYGTLSGSYASLVTNSGSSPMDITSLNPGTRYYVMVQAVNATGSMNAASEASAIPIAVPVKMARGAHALYNCVIMSHGKMKCYGNGEGNTLGDDTIQKYWGQRPSHIGDNYGPMVNLGTGRKIKKLPESATLANHLCVILDNNETKCWGYNVWGQLGYGDNYHRGEMPQHMGDNLTALDFGTGLYATKIIQGHSFNCANLNNGQWKCWGGNWVGQLGIGNTNYYGDQVNEMGDNLPPLNMGTGRTIKKMSLGTYHGCAILDNNKLKCWGHGYYGETGHDSRNAPYGNNLGDTTSEIGDNLPYVDVGTGRTVLDVAAGHHRTCVVLDNYKVKCFGYNPHGNLGYGDKVDRGYQASSIGDNLPYVDLGTNYVATEVYINTWSTCAKVTVSGVTGYRCWGYGHGGDLNNGKDAQIGDEPGEMGDNLVFQNWGTVSTVSKLVMGVHRNYALFANGKVKGVGWGGPWHGLGNWNTYGHHPDWTGDNIPFMSLPTGRYAKNFIAGDELTCVHLDNDDLMCYGHNRYGKLGKGYRANVGDEREEMSGNLAFIDLGANRTVKQVTAGVVHACAILDNDKVKCWGINDNGQLGLGDMETRGDDPNELGDNLPYVDLGVGRTAKFISAGEQHTCAILDNNKLKCWGAGWAGNLGYGNGSNKGDEAGEMGDGLPYVDVGTGRTVTWVSNAHWHTCAVLDNGQAKCWGYNPYGQLGRGNTAYRGNDINQMGDNLAAIDLGSGRTAKQIHSGVHHTCALLDNNQVKCWGYGAYGVHGLGDTNHIGDAAGEMGDALPQINLGTGRSATMLRVGGYHACAKLDNGRIKCWGYNGHGESNVHGSTGQGDTIHRGDEPNEMGDNLPFMDTNNNEVAEFDMQRHTTCMIMVDKVMRCIGRGYDGERGDNTNWTWGYHPTHMGSALRASPIW